MGICIKYLRFFRNCLGGGGGECAKKGGGAKKKTLTSFPYVSSTNVELRPKSFLNFIFNTFGTLEGNFKGIFNASPNLLNLNQKCSPKKCFL